MGKLVIKRRPSKSPQIGDLRTRIEIKKRTIGSPVWGETSFKQGLEVIYTVWSSIETIKPIQVFDGVEVGAKGKGTHKFIIRYKRDVTESNIIKYDENHYKIIKLDNADERNRFLFLSCELLGEDDLEANQ